MILLTLLYPTNCLLACVTTPPVSSVLAASATVGVLSFLPVRFGNFGNNTRLASIYLHITSFIFLIATLSISMICGMFLLNVLLPAVPILLLVGMVATYLLGPRLYLSSLKASQSRNQDLIKWAAHYSRIMGIRTPDIYTMNEMEPAAFAIHSIRPKICFSNPILKRLTTEEIGAILIHEIAHIRMKTQIFKISLSFLRYLTPFSFIHSFLGDLRPVEDRADEYVKTIQGTSEHLDNARDKVARPYS